MDTLKPNMYVRTKSGLIAKYIGYEKEENDIEFSKYNFDGKIYWYYEYYNEYVYEEVFEYWFENSVVKSSYNIIDLIEVGDYVNGMYVEDVLETFVNVATGSNYFQTPTLYENDIKSIVTKEQFESMSYRIGEELWNYG